MMATQKVVVGGSSVTASQMKDFWRQIADGSINGTQLQLFLDHQNPFVIDRVVIDWFRVYQTLGIEFNPGDLALKPNPNYWDIYVMGSVTPKMIVDAFIRLRVQVSTVMRNPDEVVNTQRDVKKGSYYARFKRTAEVDPEFAERSAIDLDKMGVRGITLVERLLLELGYFLATGEHLGTKNVTLCAGSRYLDGDVPTVYWHIAYQKLFVDYTKPESQSAGCRTFAPVCAF